MRTLSRIVDRKRDSRCRCTVCLPDDRSEIAMAEPMRYAVPARTVIEAGRALARGTPAATDRYRDG
jgi:hypothetical protein